MNNKATRLVIVGGGTAGWMAAAAISKKLGVLVNVTLIESKDIPTVGVGESTIPPLRAFHHLLGIDEATFMKATGATFKMGVKFEGWGPPHSHYIHSFGNTGQESRIAGFQNLWLLARERGLSDDFGDYCFELVAAKQAKFAIPSNGNIHYAYHLDSNKYARFLKHYCHSQTQVTHITANVTGVTQNANEGYIENVRLDSGEIVSGDLFIDCTGFQGLLIEKTLKTGYEDWRHWLPCDRAWVAQTLPTDTILPYTRAIAHRAGWRWRIPLQTRLGNGFVYSSQYMSDETALETFLDSLKEKPLTDPRLIAFTTGRRLKAWNKNCIALGLSSGFIEPLESTGIHLFMTGITRLLQLFPCGKISPALVNEYNDQTQKEFEKIRDFIILHYNINQRDDEFWRFCRNMELPNHLQDKIQLFKESARVFKEQDDPFRMESWCQVMIGQGLIPENYHKVGVNFSEKHLKRYLSDMKTQIRQNVSSLPTHREFLERYCPAEENA